LIIFGHFGHFGHFIGHFIGHFLIIFGHFWSFSIICFIRFSLPVFTSELFWGNVKQRLAWQKRLKKMAGKYVAHKNLIKN